MHDRCRGSHRCGGGRSHLPLTRELMGAERGSSQQTGRRQCSVS